MCNKIKCRDSVQTNYQKCTKITITITMRKNYDIPQQAKQPKYLQTETSWERHKSAPYLRIKNSKRTSKCQVFFYSTLKPKRWTELVR